MLKTKQPSIPSAYFITFSCYGSRLHAGNAPSVDRYQNTYGTSFVSPNPKRNKAVTERMRNTPYLLDAVRRNLVLDAILETAGYYNWKLYAAHVRTNHVHLVIRSDAKAEFVMNMMKSYASRYLNKAEIDTNRAQRWTRHGSTRNLWDIKDVAAAINYVVNEQGTPMAVFEYT